MVPQMDGGTAEVQHAQGGRGVQGIYHPWTTGCTRKLLPVLCVSETFYKLVNQPNEITI
jgi:hypothetical protein